MHDLTNTSLSVSEEHSFVDTDVSLDLFDMETRLRLDYSAFVIGFAVGIFGIGCNIVNIVIFYRQGLDNTINISFFTLAISDLGSLIALTVGSIFVSPSLVYSEIPVDFQRFAYFFTLWPHVCFADITSWITVYITAERCLCVALPLKVKQIITPRVTSFIIGAIYILNVLPAFPEIMNNSLDWQFSPERNITILSLSYRTGVDFVFIVISVLGFVPFPTVTVFTIILVVRLRQQTKWRQRSALDSQNAQISSKREIKTMNTVVLIAIVFIICYIPGVLVSITVYIVPTFNVDGSYINLFYGLWYLVFLMHGINSSVNIFLYYNMSSKFKKHFHELFEQCRSIFQPRDIDDADYSLFHEVVTNSLGDQL